MYNDFTKSPLQTFTQFLQKLFFFSKKNPINMHIAKWLSLSKMGSRREDFIQGVIHNFVRTLLFKGDLISECISYLTPSSKSWTKSLVSTFQPKVKKLKIVILLRVFWEWNQIEKTSEITPPLLEKFGPTLYEGQIAALLMLWDQPNVRWGNNSLQP